MCLKRGEAKVTYVRLLLLAITLICYHQHYYYHHYHLSTTATILPIPFSGSGMSGGNGVSPNILAPPQGWQIRGFDECVPLLQLENLAIQLY